MEPQKNKMGTAPIVPLMIKMALPAMLSMFIQALYNVVDGIFVARISKAAFSATAIAFPLQMLLISVCVGTGIGINSLVARRLGEGKKEEASQAATNGLYLSFFGWVFIALIGIFVVSPFFNMTTNNPETIRMGITYTTIVLVGSLASFIQVCIEKTLQATGNMILPMCSQLIGCVVNIILDPILIFGIDAIGFSGLGIAGAAIATVFGQFCGMLFCIVISLRKKHAIQFNLRKYKLKASVVKDIYVVGIPSIVMQAIGSVLVSCLNLILIQFTESAVNVLGVYYKLQSFVFMPVFGLNQGVMPIMGYNYGAGNKKRLTSTLKAAMIFAGLIMLIGLIVFQTVPGAMLDLFKADAETRQLGIPAMRTISLCFVPAAFGIMFSTLFQALGEGFRSLLVSLVRQLICILPAAYLLAKISLDAVWYAFPLAEVVALIMAAIMYAWCYKKVIKHLQPREVI